MQDTKKIAWDKIELKIRRSIVEYARLKSNHKVGKWVDKVELETTYHLSKK